MSRIMLLEDDLSLINGLTYALKKQGYDVENAKTVKEALKLAREGAYDLLILDVTLPDGSGFDVCAEVRKASTVPIIFLTASDEETSIIMGLDIGGDDYITKPFKLSVLMSRVNALLRRASMSKPSAEELESNGVRVCLASRQVYKNGAPMELTAGEYKLLCLFMRNPDTVLTKDRILDALWDCEADFIESSSLTVYIRRLRMKIEDDPGEPKIIVTVRGAGYKWRVL